MSQGIRRVVLLLCLACWPYLGAESNLRIVNQWSDLKFVFPDDAAKQKAIDKKYYVAGNSLPIDVDVHYTLHEKRVFVTNPRFGEGCPITLGTVDEQGRIHGYPDYSWHDNQGTNCKGLTSVFRVSIDKCQRMWVMDTGKIGDSQVCSPQVLAFDLMTDKLIFRHIVNQSSYTADSLFITPVVDVRSCSPNDCSDTYVYVADVAGHGLLVLDVRGNKSWRVTHPSFSPDPNWVNFTVAGKNFTVKDGVLGMALSPFQGNDNRYLLFHPLASVSEYRVNTSVIRNFGNDGSLACDDVQTLPGERPNQSAAEAMDSNGVLYFGLMDPPSIWCWNSATEFNQKNFYPVAIDQENLQFASGLKIVKNLMGKEEVWGLTSAFQKVATGTKSSDEINFRIFTIDKCNNSPCEPSQH